MCPIWPGTEGKEYYRVNMHFVMTVCGYKGVKGRQES